MTNTDPYILGLESSCDETAVALVDAAGQVRVNAVISQVELHARFGGVVPEEASRKHLEAFLPMIREFMGEAGVGWDQIRAIAVTYAPGLIGCLLIGVETAKALAWRHDKPLIAVHHLKAHLHAPFLIPEIEGKTHLLLEKEQEFAVLPPNQNHQELNGTRRAIPNYPHVGLIVSGGHSSLALVTAPGVCRTIATTRDDAVGEAYDKVARLLEIGFPGGPVVDRRAAKGNPKRFPFTVPMRRKDAADFSFSGLKSAVARKVEELKSEGKLDDAAIDDLCAAFQATVIESLVGKSVEAAERNGVRDLLVVGGVASNRGLRSAMKSAAKGDMRIWFPHFSLCTDNAAMIAGLAWHVPPLAREDALELNPRAVLALESK